jgi:hypothetical protein
VKNVVSLTGTIHNRVVLSMASFLMLASGVLGAQSGHKSFVPFNDFMANTRNASSDTFRSQAIGKLEVKDAPAFEEMRQHIMNLYQGVEVTHSFVLDGDHFDCMPVDQQPGVRMHGLKSIASPPPASALKELFKDSANSAATFAARPQLGAGRDMDEFGNSRVCEDKTIPMRRVTLEETSRFPTLKSYLEKSPAETGELPHSKKVVPPSAVAHKYSYTYQYVGNTGDTTTLNLWSPYVNTGLGEIFSLSQSWTIAYSPVLQTAEVGWQNYPGYYGGENSRLFIYYTADGYNHTGCYNLSCGAFVQTSGGWYFGGGWGSYSSYYGPQYEFTARYYWYAGNWWLGLGTSPTNATWVGYYPGRLYGTGAMSRGSSQLLEFGSESVGSNPWPGEGSGLWASYGWSWAAYQREIFYWVPGGAAYWNSLTAAQPSSNCYTIAGPSWSSSWGTYFYEGGPGGYNCY